ncbi:hypothetical protein CHUAL_004086 [Chamberlinius hualienensis]
MRRFFRFCGIFPYISINDNGQFVNRWAKWQPFMVFQTLLLSIYTAYSTIVDANYSDTLGRYVTGAVGIELATGVFINAISLIIYAKQWPIFFKRWSDIDRLLDIEKDEKIQIYSRRFYVGFKCYFIVQFTFTIAMAAVLIFVPESAPFKPGYTLAVFTYALHWSICLVLPELFCMLLFLAVCSRLKSVKEQLSRLFAIELPTNENSFVAVEQLEMTEDIERLRIVYQLIMDTVYQIKQVLGPVLVTTCILDTIPLPLLVYSFVKHGQSDLTIKVLKIEVFLTSFTRVAVMCLVAQKVEDESKTVFEVLRDAPTHKMTSSSRDEVSKQICILANVLVIGFICYLGT